MTADGPSHDEQSRLSIGRFSRLTGLSIGALRHYDAIDLLRPATTDPMTGYRSYRVEQVPVGRLVASLKAVDMSLEDTRAVLAADDPAVRRQLVDLHRRRLTARSVGLHRMLHRTMHLTTATTAPTTSATTTSATTTGPDHEETDMTTNDDAVLDPATERALAVSLFNHVWALLEVPERSEDQDDELVGAAHASRYHWGRVGGVKERAIGEWQISRVYSTLGRGEPAVHHARRCHSLVAGHGDELDAWLLGSAYEGLSRAYAVAGDQAVAAEWRAKAVAQLELIDDPDDREIVQADIASLPR
jgi:DNA-binding transcriptional MerR regulator